VIDQSSGARPCRVLISYAQQVDSPGHGESVQRLWVFLRECGIDARLDLPAARQRQDWALWMADQIREADFVLVIASPEYRERAEGRSGPDIGRGVQWEARLIRDAFYRDQGGLDRFVPVVLPGEDIDGLPDFLGPATSTVYYVSDFTVSGADALLRFLTGQPEIVEPPLGQVPVLGSRSVRPEPARRHRLDPVVHNEISGSVTGMVIQAGNVGALSIPASGGWQARGWGSEFQSHCATLRRYIALGEPITDVEQYGPGVRQEFSGGWVLCALPDGPVVAVTESIWEALRAVGSRAGFPVSKALFIDDNATSVDLRGGTRGPGRLWRADATQDWVWRSVR
jgi:TIR domain